MSMLSCNEINFKETFQSKNTELFKHLSSNTDNDKCLMAFSSGRRVG